jgi:hypothetical protein
LKFNIGPLLLWLLAGFFACWGMRLILAPVFPGRDIVVLPFVLNVLLWTGLDVITGGQRKTRWLIAIAPSILLVMLAKHFGTILYVFGCAPKHACL